jgi:hypothetical protein
MAIHELRDDESRFEGEEKESRALTATAAASMEGVDQRG